MKPSLGVDTGGTFTDVVVRRPDGELRVHKLLSTPADPSDAIEEGVRHFADDGAVDLVHGTTVATNALLERHGARVALVTTSGFEGLLALRRQDRPELYALKVEVAEPLAAREDVVGVDERLGYDGRVLRPLSDAEVSRVVESVRRLGADSVAICLLHAYANDAHERRLADALRAETDLHVSVSSELVREFREYERASTTAVNAFVGPVMSTYIEAIGDRLPDACLEVLQSSGGRTSTDDAARFPVHTVLSGPAGGVVGARAAAQDVGIDRIVSFDMGGTSTDVSLCDGELTISYEATIADCPIRVPVLDIFTVGAGGGSIAYRDPGGALRVGPGSAGADPGPACYGLGGREPTVTDAHAVLGRLRPDRFLGGAMSLDVDAAIAAVDRLADALELSREETAHGILDVADASMVRAINVISSQRGHDPRDYTLVSFGGAGGLHACRLADALGMTQVLVPRHPGLLSAYGMLHADRQRRFSQSVLAPLGERALQDAVDALAARADDEFDPGAEHRFRVDLRYRGQSFELTLPIDEHASVESLTERFGAEHERLYGYRDDDRELELIAVRLAAVIEAEPTTVPEVSAGSGEYETARVGFRGGEVVCRIYERADLPDEPVDGPVVITEYSGTTVVPAGWTIDGDRGHLLLRRLS